MSAESKPLSLRKLYIDHLKDLYSAEDQITEALPAVMERAVAQKLKESLEDHLQQTIQHMERLDQILNALKENPQGRKCVGMAGLLEEGRQVMSETMEPADLMDAALIAAWGKVEHYEISAYDTVVAFAELLNEIEAMNLLVTTRDEEKSALEKLSGLRPREMVLGTGMETFRQPVLKGESLNEQLKTNDSLGG
jgi:ferritin-like metal-binding protein YciE